MNIHKNARLTPIGRERLVRQVESGQTPETAARSAGVCPRTVRKWLARYASEGVAYGADAVSIIGENPYRLAQDIQGVGFRTTDQIAGKLGIAKDDDPCLGRRVVHAEGSDG